uniref:Uncharacterized protein n=1 Tax=Romanomermis culicivorax TaxID=13658 RepID=A0A915IAZ3_ROMCU
MVQNKVKHKVKLPEGVKKNGVGRAQKKSTKQLQSKLQPKKGQGLQIAPKKSRLAQAINKEKKISKAINADNEDLIKQTSTSTTK